MYERTQAGIEGHCSGTVPGGGSFVIHDRGAQIAAWSPGTEQVIWYSRENIYQPGPTVHSGIPLCFPWFADGPPHQSLSPRHGFGHQVDWHLVRSEIDDGVVTQEWGCTQADVVDRQFFAPPFHARTLYRFDRELEMRLRVHNTGADSFSYEAGLIPHLRVGNVAQVRIDGLGGADFRDLQTGHEDTQIGTLTVPGGHQLDRLYETAEPVVITDPVLRRRIILRGIGHSHTAIWNPGAERAATTPELAEEWPEMLCVAVFNVGPGAVRLLPGESTVLKLRIAVEEIP